MPATNGLQPITYNDAERETIKSYGDWTNFVNSHGHKWDDEGQADAEATLRAYGQERGYV
jgi:hypothetical protein